MANYNIYVLLSVGGTFGPSNVNQNIQVGDTLTVTVNNYISGFRNWNAYQHSSYTSTWSGLPAAWTSTFSNGPLVFTSTGAGSGLYQISIYSYRSSPYAFRSGRIYGQVTAAPASYSLSAPTSIQEGTTGTINVTATNNPSGLIYWAATPSADFSPSTGTDYITASSGSSSFSLSPIADNSTEGNETATIRLYSDSARTTQIASTTTTITDQASGGGGGGSTGGGTTGGNTSQGIEVFSQNGTKIFGTDLRTQNLQYELSLSLGAGATSATYAMADANDSTKVVITTLGFLTTSNRFTINTSSTGFSVTNNGASTTVGVLAFRIG